MLTYISEELPIMNFSTLTSSASFPSLPREVPLAHLTHFPNLSAPTFGWLDLDAEHRRYEAARAERQKLARITEMQLDQPAEAVGEEVVALEDDVSSFTSSQFQLVLNELGIKVPVGMRLKKKWKRIKADIKKILSAK